MISNKREVQSELIFPIHLIDEKKIEETKSNITISMLHHPFHWLKHTNIRAFKTFIADTSNIILSGHEHTQTAEKSKNLLTKNKVVQVEGGALQESNNENESKFNLINIDLATKSQTILVYKWEDSLYVKNDNVCCELAVTNTSPFKFKNNYEERLHKTGLNIMREDKNVLLDDIFIYPDLKIISSSSKKGLKKMSAKNLLDLTHNSLKIVYGVDNSGKNTLSKVLQSKFLERNLLPIKIDGSAIKSKNVNNITGIIKKSFKAQYKNEAKTITKYEQLPHHEIVLIVKDYHKVNGIDKQRLIESFEKNQYSNIILFSNESLKFEATTDSDLAEKLDHYAHFEILPLGHVLRDKFITKWLKLDKELQTRYSDIRRDKAERINKTIGLNIVPAYPVYLTTLLMAMETQDNTLEKNSSYGHYYHFLIMQYLNKGTPLNEADINTLFGFLSEFAYKIFISKKHCYTYSELKEFNRNYIDDVGFEPDFNILERLVKSELLIDFDNDSFGFTHKYIYYYFVAVQLSQNLDDPVYTDKIERIIERLHITEFANILMFVLHLSPKRIILEKLIIEAKKLFDSVPEFTFSPDELTTLNASIKKDTMVRLNNTTQQESRDIELRREERKESIRKAHYVDDKDDADVDSEIPVLDFFKKLNLTFKMIEILGEIVKNYAGSSTLKKEIKLDLIKNTYGMGLRSLKVIINSFEEHHKHLVDEVKKVIEDKNKTTQDGIEESIQQIVFNLASSISTDIIKRMSKALSVKQLSKIYVEISNEDSGNLAYELLNHAIKLNLPNGLDQKETVALHKRLEGEKNLLTDSALKRLVVEHLYMYETSISVKNSITAKLNIDNKQSQNQMLNQIK